MGFTRMFQRLGERIVNASSGHYATIALCLSPGPTPETLNRCARPY